LCQWGTLTASNSRGLAPCPATADSACSAEANVCCEMYRLRAKTWAHEDAHQDRHGLRTIYGYSVRDLLDDKKGNVSEMLFLGQAVAHGASIGKRVGVLNRRHHSCNIDNRYRPSLLTQDAKSI